VPELHKALDAGQGLRTLYLIEDLEEIVTDMDWMARAEIEAAKGWVAGAPS